MNKNISIWKTKRKNAISKTKPCLEINCATLFSAKKPPHLFWCISRTTCTLFPGVNMEYNPAPLFTKVNIVYLYNHRNIIKYGDAMGYNIVVIWSIKLVKRCTTPWFMGIYHGIWGYAGRYSIWLNFNDVTCLRHRRLWFGLGESFQNDLILRAGECWYFSNQMQWMMFAVHQLATIIISW